MSESPNPPPSNEDLQRTPSRAGLAAPARPPESLLVGATVVDVERGAPFAVGTSLLLRGDRIAALLTADEATARAAAGGSRIDLAGRYLVPGLVNTHVHLQIVVPSLLPRAPASRRARRYGWAQRYRNLRECTLRGVTTVRDTLNQDLRRTAALRRQAAATRPGGPRILQAVLVAPLGGVFTHEQDIWRATLDRLAGLPIVPFDAPHSGAVAFAPDADAATVRRAVDQAITERGADAIKLYDQRERLLSFRPGATVMSLRQLDAAADQCRKRGVPCTMHLLTVESFRRAVAVGVSSVAHLPSDEPLRPSDVEAALRAGLVVEPTVSLVQSLCWHPRSSSRRERERLERLHRLRLRTTRSLGRDHWHPMLAPSYLDGLARSAAGRTAILGGLYDGRRVFDYYGGLIGHGLDNLERLCAASVPLACGNDAGAVPCTPAMVGLELTLWRELLADGLVSPAALLRAVTCNGARALGSAAVTGRIAAGAPADLVAFDRDPLVDPSVLGERAAAVWRDGRLVVTPVAPGATASR